MALKTPRKLEDQLKCAVCFDVYTNPKLLPCFHVYCQRCLAKLVDRDQRGQLFLSCPTCRQVSPIPGNGVSGLKPAFHINHLLEIRDYVGKISVPCTGSEVGRGPYSNEATSCSSRAGFYNSGAGFYNSGAMSGGIGGSASVNYCLTHHCKEAEFWCETCSELVCYRCIIRDGKHYSHDYSDIGEAFERYRGDISPSLRHLEDQLATIRRASSELGARYVEITDQQVAIEAEIHSTFKRLHEVIGVRKTELVNQLHQVTQSKLKGLSTQMDQVKSAQAQLSNSLKSVRENIDLRDHGQALAMKTSVMKKAKELVETFHQDIWKPIAFADTTFLASTEFVTACLNYGELSTRVPLDPSKCTATGQSLDVAVAKKVSSVTVEVRDSNNEIYTESVESLECELYSELTGSMVRGRVEGREDGRHKITYQPFTKGRHQLHIKVEGQHIRGSPFCITAWLPVTDLGTPLAAVNQVEGPWGIAVSLAGRVIVTEEDMHRISIFNAVGGGERLRSFGVHGSHPGQFRRPYGITVDSEGNILVADFNNHRLQKFSAEGRFLAAVGSKGSGQLQFRYPSGVTFSPCNGKFYVAEENHRIQVLNSDLTFSGSFGSYGKAEGQFSCPHDVACDLKGRVYVADSDNHRIQVFTAKGRLLRMFGRRGQGLGELCQPVGIAVDAGGQVYVSDYGNSRVAVFTSEGQFVKCFGSLGQRKGEFKNPRGLAVDDSGVVYVCDSYNKRIQLF